MGPEAGYNRRKSEFVIRGKLRQSPATEVPDSATVLAQLDRVLATHLFQHSKRYPAFLRHVVEQTVRGQGDELKERTLGITVFRRSPDYDTSADPVVRNTASEVRKRLDEYYSEPGREAELRITLPTGGYVPEFHEACGGSAPVTPAKHVNFLRIPGRFRLLMAGACLITALGALGAIEFAPRKSALKLFWSPILQAPDPVLVVTDTLMTLRITSEAAAGESPEVRDVIDPKTYVNVIQESAKLAEFLQSNGKRLDYQLARNVSLATLRARPFILRGAFNNQWTQRAVAPFRFYLQLDHDPIVRRIATGRIPAIVTGPHPWWPG
jgi:hypothetical protein